MHAVKFNAYSLLKVMLLLLRARERERGGSQNVTLLFFTNILTIYTVCDC